MFGEGFVWASIPNVEPGVERTIFAYIGASETADAPASEAADRFDKETVLVYHFSDQSGSHKDSTGNNNNSENLGAPVTGALIGGGVRFTGANIVTIPPSETLEWKGGDTFTWSAWVKPLATTPVATIVRRAEGGNRFAVILNEGVPTVEIANEGSVTRVTGPQTIGSANWVHMGVVANGSDVILYVNGAEVARAAARLPALNAPYELGNTKASENAGFSGELDEMHIANVARPAGWMAFVTANQGPTQDAQRLVQVSEPESAGGGSNEALEHMMLFGDIAANMMFDGWIAVGVCILMMIFGWSVAAQKTAYLGKIEKGNEAFLKEWHKVSSDLTVLDVDEEGHEPDVFAKLKPGVRKLLKNSPLYHIYHVGAAEIRHRLAGKDRSVGLSARSLQAIRASLDASLVHEQHRMSKGLVFLTVSIAGGPYVGLLGTVVGVMITFALIAKTGDVDVNNIAPGIASALLATTMGLVVAIPALFIYSFLNTRIKNVTSSMQVFIDEFITKIAEFYPTPNEAPSSNGRHETPKEQRMAASMPPYAAPSAAPEPPSPMPAIPPVPGLGTARAPLSAQPAAGRATVPPGQRPIGKLPERRNLPIGDDEEE
ncbi:MAG: MotA/TolQ/ExbB proton channel family protein [Verrucomicrobiia bacterium]